MSEEINKNLEPTEESGHGKVLVQYADEASYKQAAGIYEVELNKHIEFAGESNDFREIRKRLTEAKDKLKSLFLNEPDNEKYSALIQEQIELLNTRQSEEQEKFEAESLENYNSVYGAVKEAVDFAAASSDFKLSREKLLAAQDLFKNLRLKRQHKDELYNLVNHSFDLVSKKQNEERENYEMECIENYHSLKQKIDAAIEFSKKSEIFSDARKALINVQNQIKGLKLKRDQRDELYQFIRDAFEDVNKRQEEERSVFNKETSENYNNLKSQVHAALDFAQTSEEYSLSREKLIAMQNLIKATKLKREHRDELFADIRKVFEELNEKQSQERDSYEAECNSNYEKLTEKVNDCFALVHGLTEFNMIRESLITLQGEVRIARLKKDQRNELFSRIREAFSLFDKKRMEYFDQKNEEKAKKLLEIKTNLEEKTARLKDVLEKDYESLEVVKSKLNDPSNDEYLINELNSKISNIENRIKEKQETIEQTKLRLNEIEAEINQPRSE